MKLFLMGKAGSGKDTIADYLVDRHGFKRFRLAQPIEDLCRSEYGMRGKDRELMIRVGEECKQRYGQNYWLDIVIRQIRLHNNRNVVVTDVRFPYEWDYFTTEGYRSIRVVAPATERVKWLRKRDGNPQIDTLGDPTEQQVDNLPADYTIKNDNSIQHLMDEIDIIIETIGGLEWKGI